MIEYSKINCGSQPKHDEAFSGPKSGPKDPIHTSKISY